MLSYALTMMLVGLPAYFGAYSVAQKIGRGDFSAGAFFLIYAATLGYIFYKFIPHGKLTDTAFNVQMPGAFVVCVVIGTAVGLFMRNRE